MDRITLCLILMISSLYISVTKSATISIVGQTLLEKKAEAIKIAEELKVEAKLVTEELRKQNKTQLADAIDEVTSLVDNLEKQVEHTYPVNEASTATLTRLLEVLIVAEIKLNEELKKAFT